MERLLEDVAEHGWTSERREAFVHRYDRQIGEAVLDLLVEYGMLGDHRALRSLRSYIEHRLRDRRAGPEHPLWELVEETYMRIYTEIFQKKLVQSYVNGVRAGTVQVDFESYLRGAVRRRFLDVLGAGEKSEKELLDAIVASKKPQTQQHYIAEAKGRFGEKVRSYLLSALSSDAQCHLRGLTDYFFERFITERYAALRAKLKPGESALMALSKAFVTVYGHMPISREVSDYIGEITPHLSRLQLWVRPPSEADSEEENGEEALERAGAVARTKDPAQGERLYWWDRLLRCRMATEQELLELQRWVALLEGNARRDTQLCLACVQLKAESTPEQRDDLRMFLVYYLSNYGAAQPSPLRSSPLQGRGAGGEAPREALSLEGIRGQALSWEEIFKIFGRECNPTRVKNRIREKFESMSSGGTP
jgi:hypothetical protein